MIFLTKKVIGFTKLSNYKLIDRGTNMIVDQTGLSYDAAKTLLLKEGSVKKALMAFGK